MQSEILPAAKALASEFKKSYSQSAVVDKIVAGIEKKNSFKS